MKDFEIDDFLENRDKNRNTGACKLCGHRVQWAVERVKSHLRASCPNVSQEDKHLYAKRNADQSEDPVPKKHNPVTQCISSGEREKIDMKIADFFFRTGISFRIADSHAFKEMIKCLNPSYATSIPSSKTLSGPLLDKQYADYSQQLMELLESRNNLTLVSDGWTNIRGDHIVNFCVKAPGKKTFFYSSIDTSGIVQNASAVAAAIINVIHELGAQKFSCLVTDNAPVMRAAWRIIQETFPHISTNGCAAHAVNLLVKDLAVKSDNAKTIKDAEKIIRFFKNHHVARGKLNEKRKASNVSRSLSTPVPTRWLSLYNALCNLNGLKYVMSELVDVEYDLLKEIIPKPASKIALDLVKSSEFWTKLSLFIKEIEYPTNVIGKLEGDDAPLSSVYHYFSDMYQQFEGNVDVQDKIKSRFEFLYTPSIGLAYLLTPKHAATGQFFDDDKLDILSSVGEYSSTFPSEITNKAQEQIIAFVEEMTTLPQKRKDLMYKMTARNYWNIVGREKYPELSKIAQPIGDMICSSATAERVWSTFGYIHSKLRNRLTNERVKKLVFIYTNSVLLDTVDKNDYIVDDVAILNGEECEDQIDDSIDITIE